MQIKQVNKIIDNLFLGDTLAMRTLSCNVDKNGDDTVITSFQCNMAQMKTTDIKLPTVIQYVLDDNGIVKSVELMDNFKGSQGISCAHGYLNKRLKEIVSGISFKEDKNILRDDVAFFCRHTFEVTAASVSFYRYLQANGLSEGAFYEETRADETEAGLLVVDKLACNDIHLNTEEKILFSPSNIKMTNDGKIGSLMDFKVIGTILKDAKTIDCFEETIKHENTPELVIMSMMRLFNYPWKRVGRELGIKRNFMCTNLVPSSVYGVMVQAIALTLFPNNYNYFQHAMAGLQRNNDVPLCAGMVVNFEEIKKYFPGLEKYMF
ncbi:MAG: hypothetical protein IJM37_08890 [Lachnospiraceae bacterium]|nr:hypothetical protein [Lachnospiraceae bacterium]